MKSWQFVLVGLILLASSGCRSDPAIPILERELRLKEDEIYRLRSTIEDFQDCADSSDHRTGSSTRGNSESQNSSERGSRSLGKGSASEPGDIAPPHVEFQGPAGTEVPDTLKSHGGSPSSSIPEVPEHLRGRSLPSIEKNEELRKSHNGINDSSNPTESEGPSLGGPVGVKNASRGARGKLVSKDKDTSVTAAKGDSREVTSIALNRMLTGGVNDGDRAGDRGLLVVIEPRDTGGRVIDAPAEISVVAIDPVLEGDAARVARWDFSADETAKLFRRTSAGPAIHIETVWPDGPPVHNKLQVFVRYTTVDGRRLEATQPIEVALAGEKSAHRTQQQESAARQPDRSIDHDASHSNILMAQRPTWSPERR